LRARPKRRPLSRRAARGSRAYALSDEIYATSAEDAARALREAGARVWMAGRPGEREVGLREAGVEAFVYASCDVLAACKRPIGSSQRPDGDETGPRLTRAPRGRALRKVGA